MAARSLVKNAADPAQVKWAAQTEKDREEQARNDMRAVLAIPQGARVIWRVLEHCRVFSSVLEPLERIQANAGRQDVGHWLMTEIEQSDDGALFRLMVEAKRQVRRQDAETDAMRTAAATETKD